MSPQSITASGGGDAVGNALANNDPDAGPNAGIGAQQTDFASVTSDLSASKEAKAANETTKEAGDTDDRQDKKTNTLKFSGDTDYLDLLAIKGGGSSIGSGDALDGEETSIFDMIVKEVADDDEDNGNDAKDKILEKTGTKAALEDLARSTEESVKLVVNPSLLQALQELKAINDEASKKLVETSLQSLDSGIVTDGDDVSAITYDTSDSVGSISLQVEGESVGYVKLVVASGKEDDDRNRLPLI